MNLKNRIIALAAVAAIAVPVVALGKYTVAKKGDKSSVTVSGSLVGAGIEAVTHEVTIADNDQDLVINVGLGAMKTGIDMRDGHFKKAMKKLGASLSVKTADVKAKLPKGGDVSGKLTLNGVTKDVKVNFSVVGEKDGVLHVTGTIPGGISRKDYQVGKKDDDKEKDKDHFCNMGVCVKDNLTVKADLYVAKP